MSVRARIAAAGVGFVGGIASGLLGVGGGIVFVPGLVLAAGLAQRRAHATSLAAILPVGVVGATVYATGGKVHYGYAALLAAGSVIGAPLGVRALARIPDRSLRLVFVAVLVVSAVRLLLP
jgi:hypothetical protein